MITQGPPENVFKGPLLDSVAFPDVLVAKCHSPDGANLELVLYPGKEAGKFQLGFKRLAPGITYTLEGDAAMSTVEADKDGSGTVDVQLDGRTALRLVKGA